MGVFNGNIPTQYQGVSASGMADFLGMLGLGGEELKNAEFARGEISADNAFQRQLSLQNNANAFTAQQNDLAWQRNMDASNTYYQRTVDDLKKAGINPIMAISGLNGADTPTAPTGSGSSASSSGSNYRSSSSGSGLGTLVRIVAGLFTHGKSGTMSQTFNRDGELVKTVINSKK